MGEPAVWIAIGATLVGCLFASIRMALLSISRSALTDLAAKRGGSAMARVGRIVDDIEGHARSCAFVALVCNLGAAFAIVWWVGIVRRGPVVAGEGGVMPPLVLDWPMLATGGLVSVVWLWFWGVVLPASVGKHGGERMVLATSPLARLANLVGTAMKPITAFVDEVVRRLSGNTPLDVSEAIGAEIMSVIDEGEREGTIDESEREMIEAVVEFRSTTAEQIMTPRTEIDAIEATDDLAEIIAFVEKVGHSRIPVYEDDMDHVMGILYVKDLLKWVTNGNTAFRIRDVVRPVMFVPESKTVRDLLTELLERKVHVVLVADEYGGTSGLVTVEDIVEEIFGEIQDEYEPEDEVPPQIEMNIGERSGVMDARAYIDDVNDALEPLEFQVPETDDYDTLGGFVITSLGRIPEAGERFREGRASFTVLEATPTRVVRVRLEVLEDDVIVEEEAGVPEQNGRAGDGEGGAG